MEFAFESRLDKRSEASRLFVASRQLWQAHIVKILYVISKAYKINQLFIEQQQFGVRLSLSESVLPLRFR